MTGGIQEKQGETNLTIIITIIVITITITATITIIIYVFTTMKFSEILLKKHMWQISYQRI